MSFLCDDDAVFFLEHFGLKVESLGLSYCVNPEGKNGTRELIRLTRKTTGQQVRGYVNTSDFIHSKPRARCMHGLSLVMFAARPWNEFKADNEGEPITPANVRREWQAWQRLAKPFRAFLTAEELAALI